VRHYNLLFLCTGNSARSIIAEAILNHKGNGIFTAYSAGSRPAGVVHAEALKQLHIAGMPSDNLRSKSWEEFTKPGAPEMDFVVTVCDNAANETCPLWPGRPLTAHWGVPDPAAATGTPQEVASAFHQAFMILDRRINLLLGLPLTSLDALTLQQKVARIGKR
jgi:arsenate reductase